MRRSIFHLSLPARDLNSTAKFYRDVLGARTGRVRGEWIDLIVFGHQVTFHHRPDEVRPAASQGVQHFGAILGWQEWEALCERLTSASWPLVMPPTVFGPGTGGEHAKVVFRDPSGHLIEVKAYRDISTVVPEAGPDDRA